MWTCLCADPRLSPRRAWDALSEESTQKLNGALGFEKRGEVQTLKEVGWDAGSGAGKKLAAALRPLVGWAPRVCGRGHWGRQTDELIPSSPVFQVIHVVLFSFWKFQKEYFSIEISIGNSGFEQPECWHCHFPLTHTPTCMRAHIKLMQK